MSKKKEAEVEQSEKLSLRMLKHQNTSLLNKNDYLYRQVLELKEGMLENQQQLGNYEALFTSFFASWKVFFLKLENMHQLIKKNGDQKLIPKFQQVFDTILEIFGIFEKIKTKNKQDFTKFAKSKVESFVKSFEQIYIEFLIDSNAAQEKITNKIRELYNAKDINDLQRKVYSDALETQGKLKDLESYFKEKQSHYDISMMLEQDLTQEKVNEVQSKYEKQIEINQNLGRRIKIMQDYEKLNKNINQLIQNQGSSQIINEERYDCVCGVYQLEEIQQNEIQALKEIQKQIQEGKLPQLDKDGKLQDETDNKQKSDKDLDKDSNQFNLTLNEKIKVLEQQNQQLSAEKLNLIKENKKLQLNSKNLEEQFFNSELFINLSQQGQELLKYSQNLKDQLVQSKTQILEIERLRQKEVSEILQKEQEEKNKLINELNNHKMDQNKNFMNVQLKEILKDYDITKFKDQFQQKLHEQQNIIKHLQAQVTTLTTNIQEVRKQSQDEEKKNNGFIDQIAKLERENIALKTIKNLNLENIQFRHPKHQTLIQELNPIIGQYCPQFNERFSDLIAYIKSREAKIDSMNQKIKQLGNQNSKNQKNIDQLYQEIEMTNEGFEELQTSNMNLQQQIKVKEDSEAQLYQEKLKEKMAFEQEKTSFNIKLKADSDALQRQQQYIDEMRQNHELTQQQNEELKNKNKFLEDNKIEQENQKAEIKKQNLEINQEMKLLQKLKEDGNIINQDMVKANEDLEQELKTNKIVLQEKLDSIQNSGEEMLRLQLDSYKEMITCGSCKVNQKQVLLIKCQHFFCKECIDNNIRVRNRACPVCRQRFDQKDIKDIFWN